MNKIIQPINDPDEIRKEAREATKEEFADYYVDQPAPDPLTWQPPAAKQADDSNPQDENAELSRQNDPLKDV